MHEIGDLWVEKIIDGFKDMHHSLTESRGLWRWCSQTVSTVNDLFIIDSEHSAELSFVCELIR